MTKKMLEFVVSIVPAGDQASIGAKKTAFILMTVLGGPYVQDLQFNDYDKLKQSSHWQIYL